MKMVQQNERGEQWWCRRDQSQIGECDWVLDQSAIARRTCLGSGKISCNKENVTGFWKCTAAVKKYL